MSELKIPGFENVHATVEYLKLFDSLFDIMNSRTSAQQFGKAPLQARNEENWKSVFENATSYISNIKTLSGKLVLQTNRYASFLGWLVNIKTLTELYGKIVKNGELKFLVTFKLSQDPLENFFSSIRMACGDNNNPTSIQFKAAFQSLLCSTLNRKVVFYWPRKILLKIFCFLNIARNFPLNIVIKGTVSRELRHRLLNIIQKLFSRPVVASLKILIKVKGQFAMYIKQFSVS